MATTTNYGWTTPDDTALVKDGAAAIRTLGSSVDTTTKALNPETTLGDIAYRSSTANVKTRLGIGTTGQVLTVAAGVPAWASASGATFAIFYDLKTNNTAGGTFTSGAWRTRDLQTTGLNQITGASLASNQITLPAGTYVVNAYAPFYRTDTTQAALYNITDSSFTIVGQTGYIAGNMEVQTASIVSGAFTIAAQKVFELQHIAATTRSSTGFGQNNGNNVGEVFSIITIAKVA